MMSDISLRITIKEESIHLFKRCIRKLLESTFILRDKDEKLYQFVSRESNRQDISEYLRMIGFDVIVEEKTGVWENAPNLNYPIWKAQTWERNTTPYFPAAGQSASHWISKIVRSPIRWRRPLLRRDTT